MVTDLLTVGQIGEKFGVTREAVVAWRHRYPNFPKFAAGDPTYPFYDFDEVRDWYVKKWPDREFARVKLHRYQVVPDDVRLTTVDFGPLREARGYLQGIRDALFVDWRVFYTKDGFSAHKGDAAEVWFLDLSDKKPAPWYIYDGKHKKEGRVK